MKDWDFAELDSIEGIAAVQDVWKEYKEKGSNSAREKLIIHYAPLVKYVAGRVSSSLPPNVEYGDLVSYGIFGLIDAVFKFEPSKGIKFETYAMSRIRGAIIDELRAIDWVPRSVRFKARELEKAYVKLENELRRSPNDEEIACELGISIKEYEALMNQVSFLSMLALDELWNVGGEKGEKVTLAETLEDRTAEEPSLVFEKEEEKELIAEEINRLPEREKMVIALYYYQGLTLREIGLMLGVTESRVCQMHTRAILRLRARIEELRSKGDI